MGAARSLTKTPMILAIVILLLIAAGSTWGILAYVSPMARAGMDMIIAQYDTYAPEVRIVNGHAETDAEVPYFIDVPDAPGVVMVIDTREGTDQEAMKYLENAEGGFVLTRNRLITKNNTQYRIVPLKDMPDIVINSRSLADLKDRFFPVVLRFSAIGLGVYFIISKLVQALLLALIPYIGGGSENTGVTYGMAFKTTVLAMIPAALVSFIILFSGLGATLMWLGYVVTLGALLIALALSFRKKPEIALPTEHGSINP